jgi:hypothetical protein
MKKRALKQRIDELETENADLKRRVEQLEQICKIIASPVAPYPYETVTVKSPDTGYIWYPDPDSTAFPPPKPMWRTWCNTQ